MRLNKGEKKLFAVSKSAEKKIKETKWRKKFN